MGTATKRRSGGTTLSVAELKTALAVVAPAAHGKTQRPVLASVRLGDGLLTATDLELRIETALDYHDDPVLLPYARLAAILNNAAGDEVSLERRSSSCVVRIGRGEWVLPTESAAEFPGWEPTSLQPVTKLPADQFWRAVRAVAHSTDDTSGRPAMGTVLIDVQDGIVNFAATDGHRLSVAECEHDLAVDDSETLVPSRVMEVLCKLAGGNANALVAVEASKSVMRATVADTTVTATLAQGTFVRWRKVIPEDHPEPTTVVGADLLSATKAAAIVTSDDSRGVTYTFTADGLHLSGKSAAHGTSSVTCCIVEFGTPCVVKLDPLFVREWLQGLPSDGEPTVSVQVKDADAAVVLRSDSYTGVIMPLGG